MRLGRNHAKREIRNMKPRQHKARGCGISCWFCNPKFYGKMHRYDARDKADIRHMQGLE